MEKYMNQDHEYNQNEKELAFQTLTYVLTGDATKKHLAACGNTNNMINKLENMKHIECASLQSTCNLQSSFGDFPRMITKGASVSCIIQLPCTDQVLCKRWNMSNIA